MRRDGFALFLVLLVVAAVELITLSTLALATHESVALAAHERSRAATRAGEAALRRLMKGWPHAAIDSLAISQSLWMRDASGVLLTVQRHGWGWYQATAIIPAGRTSVRETALLETIDYERGMREAAAAMAGFQAAAISCVHPPVPLFDDSAQFLAPDYGFAGLSWRELASIADTIITGVYPVATDTAGNPVGRFVYADTSLNLPVAPMGGVLVVRGDVVVPTGAHFLGIIVTRGRVTLQDGVHIDGAIVSRGGLPNIGDVPPVYSTCSAARALLLNPAARRLVRAQRRFIPAF